MGEQRRVPPSERVTPLDGSVLDGLSSLERRARQQRAEGGELTAREIRSELESAIWLRQEEQRLRDVDLSHRARARQERQECRRENHEHQRRVRIEVQEARDGELDYRSKIRTERQSAVRGWLGITSQTVAVSALAVTSGYAAIAASSGSSQAVMAGAAAMSGALAGSIYRSMRTWQGRDAANSDRLEQNR